MLSTLRSFRVLVTLILSIACSILVVVWPGWLTDLRAQNYAYAPVFNYSLAANPVDVTVTAGGASGATTITATLLAGSTQPVSLSASGLPSGATLTVSQPSCRPTCSTTLTITTAASTSPGTSTITVRGSPLGKTTTFTLTVIAPGFDYSLAANPVNVTVTAGGASGATTITATLLAGSTQPVSFSASGLPSGATPTFSQPSCSPTCSTTLTITTAASTAPGTATITVRGSPLGKTTTFTLTVTAPGFDYSLAANPVNVTVTAGGASGATTITATLLAGSTQPVSFSASGLPSGATPTFSQPSCSPTCSTTLTITTAASTAPGTATITVTGSPLGKTTTFTLTVTTTRTLAVVSGNNQTGVINSTLPKPLVVSVTPPTPSVTVNWEVTGGAIPSATSTPTVNGSAQITLTLGPTPGTVSVRASISGGGVSAASSVTFIVNDATQTAITGLKMFSPLGNVALSTAAVQATNIGLRLAALRGGATGMSMSGLSINMDGQSLPLNAAISSLGDGGGASADPSRAFGGLGIFLNGQGSFGDQRATTREPGFDFHTAGLTLGSDYRFTKNLVLGAAFGYLKTKAELDASAGQLTTNGYSVSGYGIYHVSDKVYLDGIATYGWNTYDSTRNVPDVGESAKGNTDGNQFALSVGGGYDFNFGALTAGPSLRVNYIRVHIDGFQERGADLFNLRVDSQKVESLTTALGGQLSYAISMPWGVLLPLARFDWEHGYRGGSRLITGSLVADPLRTSFAVPTNNPDRNYFNLGAGVTATLTRGASAFFYYETVLGRDNVTNHSFNAGVRFAFE